ncbi:MAG: hypothetical protein ACFFD4_07025 [Candidatus Odinarchaeota archaeon]
MENYPVVEELPGQRTGIWQERLKAKHIYRELRYQRQLLKKNYKRHRSTYIIAILVIPISILSFFLGIPFFESVPIAPFVGFMLLVVAIFVAIGFYGKAQRTKRKAQRFGVLGLLSRKLASECSLVDLFIDFGDASKVTNPYRTARSPYSGARKRYYHFPWLRYDTNLRDGTKFLLSSHQKVKTKSNSTVRDITTFNFKFSFQVYDQEVLPHERLMELEDIIIAKTEPYFGIVFSKQDYMTGGFIKVDYPLAGVLRFTLKIWGNSEHLIPSGLIVMLGELNAVIRSSYPEYTGFALHPLKRAVESPQTVVSQLHRSHSVAAVEEGLKQRQWEIAVTSATKLQSAIDVTVAETSPLQESREGVERVSSEVMQVDLTLEEEKQFDNLNLYIGDPITTVAEDGEPYLEYRPKYGEFTELAVGIRTNSFVWTATCKKALDKHLELEIAIDPSKDYRLWDIRYAANSAQLAHSPISSFTVGLKIREVTESLMRLSIHGNDHNQPIIFAETVRNKPENIYKTFEVVKSLARELDYPRFV